MFVRNLFGGKSPYVKSLQIVRVPGFVLPHEALKRYLREQHHAECDAGYQYRVDSHEHRDDYDACATQHV